MSKPLAFSFSAVNLYETCPKQYEEIRLLKKWSDGNKFSFAGQEEHKALELRVDKGTPLPSHLQGMEETCQKILALPGRVLTEYQMAVTKMYQPCSWFAGHTWYRAIADVLVINEAHALNIDYKTGKRRPKESQLATSAACTFIHFPKVQTITAVFLWIKTRQKDSYTFRRSDLGDLWKHVLPTIERIEWSDKNNNWSPKPSGLCREYCPVKSCCHNGV